MVDSGSNIGFKKGGFVIPILTITFYFLKRTK